MESITKKHPTLYVEDVVIDPSIEDINNVHLVDSEDQQKLETMLGTDTRFALIKFHS